MGTHLFLGMGGETGIALSERLAKKGDRVVVTTHRLPLPDSINPTFFSWDLESPSRNLAGISEVLGNEPLSSLSLFAHPPFRRTTQEVDSFSQASILDFFPSLLSFLEMLRPRIGRGTSVIFFFPSLSRHRADGYLSARLWIGALHGLFEEWSRNREGIPVTGIDILVAPNPTTPHLTQDFIDRIAGRTARGRLATAQEIADFTAWLILSKSPLFHGQLLHTEGGPYY